MALGGASPDLKPWLLRCRPFQKLHAEVSDLVFEAMVEARFADGEHLTEQGGEGDCVYLLVEGEAHAVLRTPGHPDRTIAAFGAGEIVGEMALLTQEPRTATVVAKGDVHTLVLGAKAFHELATRHPEVGVVLTHVLADRLGEQTLDGMGGKQVGHYRIVRTIARGGMSVVYEAQDERDQRIVALKMMSHRLVFEPEALQRFQREADILLALDHDGVSRFLEHFPAYRTSFIAMEHCDGPDLEVIARRHAPFPEDAARAIIGQVAEALSYLHGRGVVHRDLKPDNVISTTGGRFKLTDFGLAKVLDGRLQPASTGARTLMGTPLYMAPEQISAGDIGAPVDLYALGCIVCRLVMGRLPFRATTLAELVYEKMNGLPPTREELGASEELHALVATCLSRDPAARTVDLDAIAAWASPFAVPSTSG